jgi:ubiquitin-protein ligase
MFKLGFVAQVQSRIDVKMPTQYTVNINIPSTMYSVPDGTPYENGYFKVKLLLTKEFPQIAPKGKKV